MPDVSGATFAACERPRRPVWKGPEGLEPLRGPVRQALAEVAAEEVAADPRDQQTRGEARHRVVGPGEQPDLLRRQERPAPEQSSDEPSVGDEAAVAQREQIPDRFELVEVGRDVEHARARQSRERGDHVTVGHRLLGEAVLLGERERQIPADDQRGAEHDAVGVDWDVRRFVARGAPDPRADGRRDRDDRRGDRVVLLAATPGHDGVDERDGSDGGERPPELEGHVRQRDAK